MDEKRILYNKEAKSIPMDNNGKELPCSKGAKAREYI